MNVLQNETVVPAVDASIFPTPTQSVARQRMQLAIEQLDELEAYLKVDEFFAKQGELVELVRVLGVDDFDVLEDFLRLDLDARSAPAIEMVPVTFVAWASDVLTDQECTAAIRAVYDSQLTEFPRTLSVVQSWLDVRPPQELWDLWIRYMHCRFNSMSVRERRGLHLRVTQQVQVVARASGGWMGVGSVCRNEQVVIDFALLLDC